MRMRAITIEPIQVPEDMRPHTGYQRLRMYAETFDLLILKPEWTALSPAIREVAQVRECGIPSWVPRVPRQLLFYCWATFMAIRLRRTYATLCTPYGWATFVGLLVKTFAGGTWIYSVWDDIYLDAEYNRQIERYGRSLLYSLRGALINQVVSMCDLLILNMEPGAVHRLNVDPSKVVFSTNGHTLEGRISAMQRRESVPMSIPAVSILYVGDISEPRGCRDLIEAASRLQERGIGFRLQMVGSVSEHLRPFLSTLKPDLLSRIEFTGSVPHERCCDLIAQSDICVFPFPDTIELRYIYPIKVLEYMALGRAIVSTSLQGVGEYLVNNRNCLLVPPSGVDRMADALGCLAVDPALRSRLGQEAALTAMRYRWSDINRRLSIELLARLGATLPSESCESGTVLAGGGD